MYNSSEKKKIYIVVAGFIGVFVVISVIALIAGRDTSLPSEITMISVQTPEEAEVQVKPGIFGVEAVYASSLSTFQASRLNEELQTFLTEKNLINLTIDKTSVAIVPVPERGANMVRFTATSDTNVFYTVTGEYLTANDIFVIIYNSDGSDAYRQHYDTDEGA